MEKHEIKERQVAILSIFEAVLDIFKVLKIMSTSA